MAFEKVVLFDGTDLSKWTKRDLTSPAEWVIGDDGAMTVKNGCIVSTEKYKDAHIHVEFWLPYMPNETDQGRANSGVYVHGCYEIQVLDIYGMPDEYALSDNKCGGIYSMYPPLCNANLEPETWQTYDIYVRAPRFNENNEIIEDGRMTVILNGKCVQNNVILYKNTPGGVTEYRVAEGPLLLQDHGNPIRFRNVWFERM